MQVDVGTTSWPDAAAERTDDLLKRLLDPLQLVGREKPRPSRPVDESAHPPPPLSGQDVVDARDAGAQTSQQGVPIGRAIIGK